MNESGLFVVGSRNEDEETAVVITKWILYNPKKVASKCSLLSHQIFDRILSSCVVFNSGRLLQKRFSIFLYQTLFVHFSKSTSQWLLDFIFSAHYISLLSYGVMKFSLGCQIFSNVSDEMAFMVVSFFRNAKCNLASFHETLILRNSYN